jgi:hypothetical protein
VPLDQRLPAHPDTLCLVYRADMQRTPGAATLIQATKQAVR